MRVKPSSIESLWQKTRREIALTALWLLASTAGATIITASAMVFRISWPMLPGRAFVALAVPEDTSGWVLISSQAVIALFVGAIVNVATWTCILFFSIPPVSHLVRHLRCAKADT
jgi:hypothetical protein